MRRGGCSSTFVDGNPIEFPLYTKAFLQKNWNGAT